MLLPVNDVLKALRTTRADFAELFIRAQVYVDREDRRLLDGIAPQTATDREAFRIALDRAVALEFDDRLLRLIAESGLESGAIIRAIRKADNGDEGDAELQAMGNELAGFPNPEILYKGIYLGMKWTAKVLINGVPKGTGVLVRENQVLTAWHVVRELFVPVGKGLYEPSKEPRIWRKLSFLFDDHRSYVGVGKQKKSEPIPVYDGEEWCLAHSSCHAEELKDKLPKSLKHLDTKWDYAVLRLSKVPGIERRAALMDSRSIVPESSSSIFVFQHPAGSKMKMDPGKIAEAEPKQRSMIPRVRFLHGASTLGGSSGGPCFDYEFSLFGVHQGVWQKSGKKPKPGAKGKKNGKKSKPVINRGVPLTRVIEDINAKRQGGLPAVDQALIPTWQMVRDATFAPIFGTARFQQLVWLADAGAPDVIVIRGEDQGGKSYCLEILGEMLDPGSHLRVVVDAAAIAGKKDALAMADALAQKAGAPLPPVTPVDASGLNRSTWVTKEVLGALVQAFDSARGKRKLWLCIKDLNHKTIPKHEGSDLLYALYEKAVGSGWLRIVLDDVQGELQGKVGNAAQTFRRDRITRDEIADYVERYYGYRQEICTPETVARIANFGYDKYQKALNKKSKEAIKDLADELSAFLDASGGGQ